MLITVAVTSASLAIEYVLSSVGYDNNDMWGSPRLFLSKVPLSCKRGDCIHHDDDGISDGGLPPTEVNT